MAILIGDSAKPSGTLFGYSRQASENQEAFLFTMPEDGYLTRVGIWSNSDSSYGLSAATAYMVIWDNDAGGNLILAQSAGTVTFIETTSSSANLDNYEADLADPLFVAGGTDFYAGFSRDPDQSHFIWVNQAGPDHIHRRRTTWPGSMAAYTVHAGDTRGIYCYYERPAALDPFGRMGIFGI